MYCAKEILTKLYEQSFDNDLVVRHGLVLGVAESIYSLGEMDLVKGVDVLSRDVKSSIAELVPSIEKAHLYRGRGGEIMRSASCRMIECLSLAEVPMTVKQQVSSS